MPTNDVLRTIPYVVRRDLWLEKLYLTNLTSHLLIPKNSLLECLHLYYRSRFGDRSNRNLVYGRRELRFPRTDTIRNFSIDSTLFC